MLKLETTLRSMLKEVTAMREHIQFYTEYVNPEGTANGALAMCEYCHRQYSSRLLNLPSPPVSPVGTVDENVDAHAIDMGAGNLDISAAIDGLALPLRDAQSPGLVQDSPAE